MAGESILEVTRGLAQFARDVMKDLTLALSLEVQIDFFCETRETNKSFGPIDDGWVPPEQITTGPRTWIASAINGAIDDLQTYKESLTSQGIPIRHSFLFVLTDGQPNDPPGEFELARDRLAKLQSDTSNRFTCFLIGIGDKADMTTLQALSPRPIPLLMREVKDFSKFMAWVLDSMRPLSRSAIGQKVELPNPLKTETNPEGWASIG